MFLGRDGVAGTLLGNGVYGLVYTVMLLAIAILIFSRREF